MSIEVLLVAVTTESSSKSRESKSGRPGIFRLSLCRIISGRLSVEIPANILVGSVDDLIYRAVKAFAMISLTALCLAIRCPPIGH